MRKVITVLLISTLIGGSALAAGFGIGEFGARSAAMGNAAVARAYDASTLFYNPAGLAFLSGTQFYGGVTGIFAKARFVGAAPLLDNTVHLAEDQFFPPVGVYLSHSFSDKFAAGIGLTNPFGLGVAWGDDFPGRFISKDVTLKSFYISPAVAYKIHPNVAVSVGLDVVLTTVSLERNVLLFNTDGAPGTGTEVGSVVLDGGGDPAYGFTAGIQYRGEKLGLGFSYRHNVTAEFNDADADFTIFNDKISPQMSAIANALLVDQKGSTELAFPNYFAAGIYYKLLPKLGAEFTWAWYGWSKFDQIVLSFTDSRLNETIPEDYEDVSQFRIGAEYEISSSFSVRAGYIRDKTPQPIQSVSPLLPDDTRNDYSIGFGYKSGNFTLDAGYMFVDIGTRSTVDANGVGRNDNGFNGEYNSKADLFMFSLGYLIK